MGLSAFSGVLVNLRYYLWLGASTDWGLWFFLKCGEGD